ncbi:MAG TPA: 2-phosphosulfolactate phosphatase [Longimicrobiales bacterium]|nr:2-phosphosulfolactate phosphatase [Longimicrobiales bacterium]
MRVDVAFTPAEVRGGTGGRTVVVVDVLRATSTIIHALVSGARSVLPVAGVEEAARKAEALGRDAATLCGERDTQPIRGFDLGNSPPEFTRERVGGKTLVMTTTNGTAALLEATGAARCYVGAMLNVSAVAGRLREEGGDALLLCAGREGAFAAEDALCAGRILRLLREAGAGVTGNDAAAAAWRLARTASAARVLERSAAGRRLKELGRGEDIAFCAREDVYTSVPVFDELRITL